MGLSQSLLGYSMSSSDVGIFKRMLTEFIEETAELREEKKLSQQTETRLHPSSILLEENSLEQGCTVRGNCLEWEKTISAK